MVERTQWTQSMPSSISQQYFQIRYWLTNIQKQTPLSRQRLLTCWPTHPDHHPHQSFEWQVSTHWGYSFRGDRGRILIGFNIYWAKCLGCATSFLPLIILLTIAIIITFFLSGRLLEEDSVTQDIHWRGSFVLLWPYFSLTDTVDKLLDSIEDEEWGRVYGKECCFDGGVVGE